MKMKSLVLIFIALGCGLVASIGISQVMERNAGKGGPVLETEQILVALDVIDSGAKLDAQKIKLEDWPKAKIPEGAIRSLDDAKDKYAQARFFKGEPIIKDRISDNANTVTQKIPPGFRTSTIKVDEDTVMEGMSPGDKVDVMVFLRAGQDIPTTGAHTILKNIAVFSKGAQTERVQDGKGETQKARTISLIVTPEQAVELAMASQMGKVTLTLRPNDPDGSLAAKEEPPTKIEDLIGAKKAPLASMPTLSPAIPNAVGGFIKSLNDTAKLADEAKKKAAAAAIVKVPEVPLDPSQMPFRMTVFSPVGVDQYYWKDRKALPIVEPVALAGPTNHGGSAVAPAPVVPPAHPSKNDEASIKEVKESSSLNTESTSKEN